MAAEHEVAGLELLRTRVLQVNEELVEEQRKLAAAVREITRQKQLLSQVVPGYAEAMSYLRLVFSGISGRPSPRTRDALQMPPGLSAENGLRTG